MSISLFHASGSQTGESDYLSSKDQYFETRLYYIKIGDQEIPVTIEEMRKEIRSFIKREPQTSQGTVTALYTGTFK